MRPVRRGSPPKNKGFRSYKEAHHFLVSRMGQYCNYCERPIKTQLAVEHIQPKKGPHAIPHLSLSWSNFLLACVNCNSTKGDKRVVLAEVLLPDRDNTFAAFTYTPDGMVQPLNNLNEDVKDLARKTLTLTGLDKGIKESLDENGRLIALDRVSQRREIWLIAKVAKSDVEKPGNEDNEDVKKYVVQVAKAHGYFSVWMTVFAGNKEMRNRFIDAFKSTRDSGCFDADSNQVSPAHNPDGLENGGKI